MSKVWVDHKGRKFKSKQAMCDFWDVEVGTFSYRMKIGKSLEFALTAVPNSFHRSNIVEDHLGNKFNSIVEMADYYNITAALYHQRRRSGYTLEEALTGIRVKNTTKDHKGNTFSTVKEMTDFWHLSPSAYYARRHRGMTLEEALTA